MPMVPGAGLRGELRDEIDQLARGAAADQLAVDDGADARAVIAAIFHPPQAIDQPVRDLFLADNTDDSTHVGGLSLENVRNADAGHLRRENRVVLRVTSTRPRIWAVARMIASGDFNRGRSRRNAAARCEISSSISSSPKPARNWIISRTTARRLST